MKIFNLINREQVIDALNIEPIGPVAHDRFVRRYVERSDSLTRSEVRQFVLTLRAKYLRTFVDAWIETGEHEDGSESPYQRDLLRALTVLPAVLDYWDKHGPKVGFSATANGLSFTLGEAPRLPPEKNNPLEGTHVEALRFFTALMMSDWKEHLCKCRYCGSYFLHKKPRQKSYVRGLFCSPQHQRLFSATACTREGRIRVRTKLNEIAAKWLLQQSVRPSWHEDPNQRRRLATYLRTSPMSQRLGLMIQSNWVARYHREIEEKRLELRQGGTES